MTSNNHHHHRHLISLLSALSIISKSVIGAEYRIKTSAEFTDFVNSVNTNGESYSGTTVYLDSDLSLSGVTDPIGNNTSSYFLGVFDGQGHTISNLKINSTTEYAGLFGYSTGLTIRNVVLDESCSIVGSFIDTSGYTYVAGFIGHCIASAGSCILENDVNMGSVTFNGLNDQLRLGGVAGQLGSSVSYTSYVRNCVNYGPLTHSGKNNWCSDIGGIVGALGDTEYYKYIQNCANYGTIMHIGTTVNGLRIAGIVGYSKYGYIDNCLSAGKISVSNAPSSDFHKGSLAGYINFVANISYCYFTNDVNASYLNSDENKFATNTPYFASTVNSTLLSSLNTQATNNGWNRWVSLHLNGGKVNSLTQDTLAVTGKPFPDPVKEGDPFIHWCKDENCNSVYDPQVDDISGITDLYAHWTLNKYTLTFVFDNGAENEVKTLNYNEAIVYPADPTKEGHTFNGWSPKPATMPTRNITVTVQWTPNNYTITFNATGGVPSQQSKNVTYGEEYGDLPSAGEKTGYTFGGWFTGADEGVQVASQTTVTTANDHTLYAHWTLNKYTITFDFDNGAENEVRILSYNEVIVYPADPTKEGHTFNGWSPKPETMPAENITVTAQWIEKPSEYVEIVFGKKGLKEEDVREILQTYTQEEFVIEKIEEGKETGDVRVIVKFVDQAKADSFVERIRESSEFGNGQIKKVGFINDPVESFSLLITLFLLLVLLTL